MIREENKIPEEEALRILEEYNQLNFQSKDLNIRQRKWTINEKEANSIN